MSSVEFINDFYRAIIHKEVAKIVDAYAQSEDTYVILEGPRLATKGYDQIASGWKDFCNSKIELKAIQWVDGPWVYENDYSASLIGIIELDVDVDGLFKKLTYRVSFTLKRENSKYYIIHEHVSGALSDPYGIGDWKKKIATNTK